MTKKEKLNVFEIYFDDLTEEAKERLLKKFNTSLEEENWEGIPLCIIEREED